MNDAERAFKRKLALIRDDLDAEQIVVAFKTEGFSVRVEADSLVDKLIAQRTLRERGVAVLVALCIAFLPMLSFAGSMDQPYSSSGVGRVELVGMVVEKRPNGIVIESPTMGLLFVINYHGRQAIYIDEPFATRANPTTQKLNYRDGYRPIPVYDASGGK